MSPNVRKNAYLHTKFEYFLGFDLLSKTRFINENFAICTANNWKSNTIDRICIMYMISEVS